MLQAQRHLRPVPRAFKLLCLPRWPHTKQHTGRKEQAGKYLWGLGTPEREEREVEQPVDGQWGQRLPGGGRGWCGETSSGRSKNGLLCVFWATGAERATLLGKGGGNESDGVERGLGKGEGTGGWEGMKGQRGAFRMPGLGELSLCSLWVRVF